MFLLHFHEQESVQVSCWNILNEHPNILLKVLYDYLSGSSECVYTVYTLQNVYTVYTVYTVYNVHSEGVYTVYTVQNVYTVYTVNTVYTVDSVHSELNV